MFFHGFTCDCYDVEEPRESYNQVIFLSSSEHGVLVDICVLCSSQVSPSRKTPYSSLGFFPLNWQGMIPEGKTYNKRKATSLVFWEMFL